MANGESVNCEEIERELMKNEFYGVVKKIEFSNWISVKRGWQMKNNFLGVKYVKSNKLKKGEKMILVVKKSGKRCWYIKYPFG